MGMVTVRNQEDLAVCVWLLALIWFYSQQEDLQCVFGCSYQFSYGRSKKNYIMCLVAHINLVTGKKIYSVCLVARINLVTAAARRSTVCVWLLASIWLLLQQEDLQYMFGCSHQFGYYCNKIYSIGMVIRSI
jgi:hypothetical protein